MPEWVDTDGEERPPCGSRCAVSRTVEGNEHYDLSIYLGGTDQWDDSIERDEYIFKPFTHYECFIVLPERT